MNRYKNRTRYSNPVTYKENSIFWHTMKKIGSIVWIRPKQARIWKRITTQVQEKGHSR